MRIAIVTGPFYPTPPAPTGAVQRIWSDLAGHFAREGHEVTLLACRAEGQAKQEIRSDGVRVLRRTSMRQSPRIYFDLVKDFFYSLRMAALAPRADILVTNSFWMPVVARLRPSRGKVYVSVARMPKGQMNLYRRAARIHTVSNAVARAIIAEQPSLAPIVKVIPNPIDIVSFAPPRSPRNRSAATERTILYTGRIHPEKGSELLVQAFKSLDPLRNRLRLRLMGASSINEGGGGEPYLRQIRSVAGNLPVEIADPVWGRAALAQQMHAADFYVYPSLAEKGESFGVAPLEAMATGLPVVVSDLDCFKDFVHHDRTGLIFNHRDADPVAALAAQLRRLIDDESLSQSLGTAAVTEAQKYGYQQVAQQFLADFEEVMSHR